MPVRIIPIGGVEEIGRNMTVVEYGDEIVVIDAGIQFPEEETPGIDFIIPNTEYLEKNKSKIKALVISHGHMDHVGAVPYLIDKLGFPVIYTTRFSKAIIQKRQDEFRHLPTLKIEEVVSNSIINLFIKLQSLFIYFVSHCYCGWLRSKFFIIIYSQCHIIDAKTCCNL